MKSEACSSERSSKRAKAEQEEHTSDIADVNSKGDINIIEQRELARELIHLDVSKYQPKKVPSLTWCECIKKIWNDDPLISFQTILISM